MCRYNVSVISDLGHDVCISLTRLLLIRVQHTYRRVAIMLFHTTRRYVPLLWLLLKRVRRTWACLLFHTSSFYLLPSLYYISPHTLKNAKPTNLKLESNNKEHGSSGSHTTICSKLAQLTLRNGHKYADSQARSQAGSQAYRCLGWRDRRVGVGVGVE